MKQIIDDFIKDKHVAIAGVSRNSMKWGNAMLKELKKKEYQIYPVNPHASELEGEKCYPDLKSLPANVSSLIVAIKPKDTEKLVKEIPGTNIRRIWMQKGGGKGSASPEAIKFCKENNIDLVYGLCPMMFYVKGFHTFHFKIRKFFGGLPLEYVRS